MMTAMGRMSHVDEVAVLADEQAHPLEDPGKTTEAQATRMQKRTGSRDQGRSRHPAVDRLQSRQNEQGDKGCQMMSLLVVLKMRQRPVMLIEPARVELRRLVDVV